jgi:cell division protein FtsB
METKVGTHLKPSITPTNKIPIHHKVPQNRPPTTNPTVLSEKPNTISQQKPQIRSEKGDRPWNNVNTNKDPASRVPRRHIPKNPPRRAARRAARPLGKAEFESSSSSLGENEDSEEGTAIYSLFDTIMDPSQVFDPQEDKKQEIMMNEIAIIKEIKEKILNVDIDVLEENIDLYKQTISKLEFQNKNLSVEIENESVTIQNLKDQSENLSTENKDLKTKTITLTAEIKDLKSKIDNLSSVIAGKNFSPLSDEDLDELFQKIMEEKSTRSRCVVCLEKQRSLVCTPCGHLCICNAVKCSQGIRNTCPICRSKVLSFTKVYT